MGGPHPPGVARVLSDQRALAQCGPQEGATGTAAV